MPKYNTSFDLGIDELEIIEDALRNRKSDLSRERLELISGDVEPTDVDALAALDESIAATHELLGHLHNQKVFFRPEKVKNAPYIGG